MTLGNDISHPAPAAASARRHRYRPAVHPKKRPAPFLRIYCNKRFGQFDTAVQRQHILSPRAKIPTYETSRAESLALLSSRGVLLGFGEAKTQSCALNRVAWQS